MSTDEKAFRKFFAALILFAAFTTIVWCAVFALGAFGREVQMEAERATWAGVREFATWGAAVIDGIVLGAVLCVWSFAVLREEATTDAT